jgi:hypothetical protein
MMQFAAMHEPPVGPKADLGQDIVVHRAIPGLDSGNSGSGQA